MKSWLHHGNRRVPRGFTLIELLVVIAIIAVLAAILFPVFAKVREKAFSNACLSNQRQIALSIIAAAQDNDETLPLPNQWLDKAGISDPKLFDCPSNTKKGSLSEPDYGYNEFLFDKGKNFDTDPNDVVPVKMSNVDYPQEIELTADITGPSPNTHDPYVNPFPKSYVVNGLGNTMSVIINSDFRHQNKIAVSFLDGHVVLLKKGALDCGNSKSIYGIPRAAGKVYIDFSQITDDAAAKLAWRSFASKTDLLPGMLLNETFYIPADKSYNMRQGEKYILYSQTTGGHTLVTDVELDPTTRWQIRHYDPLGSVQYPPYGAGNVDKDGDGIAEGELLGNLIMIDMSKRLLILGATYGLSISPQNPNPGDWMKLKGEEASIIKEIPSGANRFRILLDSTSNASNVMRWYANNSPWYNHATSTASNYTYRKQVARITVEINGKTFLSTDYTWPVSYWAMQNTYGLQWRSSYGGMRVHKIMYTAGR